MIQSACTTQLTAQAQNFKTVGCDAAATATAPVAKAAEDAGKAATSAAPTPSATAAPNVDAKGRPCKRSIAVKGVCRDVCRSDDQCREGLVCNGEVPGRTEKFCGDMVCTKPGEKRLRENHFTVTCAVPCNSTADCKGGKKCGETLYFNEEANHVTTRACE